MKNLFVILSLLVILNSTAAAQDFINSLQQKFGKIENLQSDFVQYVKTSNEEKKLFLKGKFFFEKDEKYRIEISDRLIISDGTTIWNYDIGNKKVVIASASDDLDAFSISKFVNVFPGLCDSESLPALDGLSGVKLTPRENLGFKEAKLFADQSFLLKKILIEDFTGTVYEIELNNILVNTDFTDNFFSFDPPAGIEIIDLR